MQWASIASKKMDSGMEYNEMRRGGQTEVDSCREVVVCSSIHVTHFHTARSQVVVHCKTAVEGRINNLII